MPFPENETEQSNQVPASKNHRGYLKLRRKGSEVMLQIYNVWGTLDSQMFVEGHQLEEAVSELGSFS